MCRERRSSWKEEQKALKAGQRAEAGGPGGPTAKVQDETRAPARIPSWIGGRSPFHDVWGRFKEDDGRLGKSVGEYEEDEGEGWYSVRVDTRSWVMASIEVGMYILLFR